MTKREADELTLIEDNVTVDEASGTVWIYYPLTKDPALLSNNRAQAIAIESGVQDRLIKSGELEVYNKVIRDYIERGVFRELSQEEMDDWDKTVNYVSHHGVPKPSSMTNSSQGGLQFVSGQQQPWRLLQQPPAQGAKHASAATTGADYLAHLRRGGHLGVRQSL